MRKTILMLTVIALIGIGCKQQKPPAWAITAPEATVGSIISGAVSTVNQYHQDQTDCAAVPTLTKCGGVDSPAIKTAMQDIQKALTIAQPQYQQWAAALKANPAALESANLAAAISTIETTLAQLPSLK